MKALRQNNPAWGVAALCQALSVPRSSFYYRPRCQDEAPLRAAISEAAGAWPRYGSQRIAAQMRREGVTFQGKPVGERRTRRLMRQMGLLAKARPRKVRTTNSQHSLPRFANLVQGLSVTHPDQVWVSDITYVALGSGFAYLAVIMDVFESGRFCVSDSAQQLDGRWHAPHAANRRWG